MHRLVRGVVAGLGIALLAVPAVEAQERRTKEVRIDLLQLEHIDGTTSLGLELPGTVALGIYLTKHLAIEPQLGLRFVTSDDFSANFIELGLFAPYYFKGDFGRSGLFVSPGLVYNKAGGDFDSDGVVNFGLDVGVKRSMRENVAFRLAAALRTGDSFEDIDGDRQYLLGARAGLGIFWK